MIVCAHMRVCVCACVCVCVCVHVVHLCGYKLGTQNYAYFATQSMEATCIKLSLSEA